jgi:hypothetical protein
VGVAVTDLYDFKGNSLQSTRQFTSDYKNPPDWSQNPGLESETFSSSTVYDALNRAIASTTPDGTVYRPTFSVAALLEKVDVNLRGALVNGQPVWTPFVTGIAYDAKGHPLKSYVQGGDPSELNPSVFAQEILVEQTIYGDSADAGLTALDAQRCDGQADPRVEQPQLCLPHRI